MLQLLEEWGLFSLDSANRKLAEANPHLAAATQEAIRPSS
jgi:hypothetical protein